MSQNPTRRHAGFTVSELLIGISLSLIRMHEQYAETGRVPESYTLGGRKGAALSLSSPAVVGRAPVVPPLSLGNR